MGMQLRQQDSWVIVRLEGRVDSFNYELVSQKIAYLVRMGKTHIALDLQKVVFLSLPTLRFFAQVAQKLNAKSGSFTLIGCQSQLEEPLSLFNRNQSMTLVRSEDELPLVPSALQKENH